MKIDKKVENMPCKVNGAKQNLNGYIISSIGYTEEEISKQIKLNHLAKHFPLGYLYSGVGKHLTNPVVPVLV